MILQDKHHIPISTKREGINLQIELPSQRADGGCLAAARGAVQEEISAVLNTGIVVPLLGAQERKAVVDNCLLYSIGKDQGIHGRPRDSSRLAPGTAVIGSMDNQAWLRFLEISGPSGFNEVV